MNIKVPKKQHRLIIGPKGSVLNEIMQKSGCIVDVPLANDENEEVVIRGPENMLTFALQLTLEKVSLYLLILGKLGSDGRRCD